MTPEAIVKRFNLQEETANRERKRIWWGSRGGHGKIIADPTGDWAIYDKALDADIWDRHDPERPGWQYVEGWIDGPYRVVWISYEHLATFTYCEGDLTLVVCDDRESFDMEIRDGEVCYGPRYPRGYTLHPDGTKTYDD